MSKSEKPFKWQGACRCGSIRFTFTSVKRAMNLQVRSCLCRFCAKRAARCTSDSEGYAEFKIKPGALSPYDSTSKIKRILCKQCGVYVGTLLLAKGDRFVTLNVNTFEQQDEFNPSATPVDYSNTTIIERTTRWAKVWTPMRGQFT